MGESKHTPGPWEVREGGNYIRVGRQGYNERADRERYLGAEAGGLFEADLRFQYTEAEFAEALANARLAAAAPEMLEALRQARGAFAAVEPHAKVLRRIHHEILGMVRAAIAKAEGREP